MPGTHPHPSDKTRTRQLAYLRYIAEYTKKQKIPPSMRDFMRVAKLKVKSTSVVNYYLTGLEAEGLVKRLPRTARGLVITQKGQKALKQI